MKQSGAVLLCVEDLNRSDGKVWAVQVKGRWQFARTVWLNIPLVTVFKGAKARQPKAFLVGVGRVTKCSGGLRIDP